MSNITELTNTKIIDSLIADKAFLYKRLGVINIGLFGSYAKGKQNFESDIDILVDLKSLALNGLQVYKFIWKKSLEEKFNWFEKVKMLTTALSRKLKET